MTRNLRGRDLRPNRLEIRLSDGELENLNELCATLDKNASEILREALKAFDWAHRGDSTYGQIFLNQVRWTGGKET